MTATAEPRTTATRSTAYSVVVGIASLVVLLQAVWAGLFIREGEDYRENWVEVHARGADLAILLAVVALVIAFVKLRSRRDLLIGTAVFAVALVLESYLGGLIGDSPAVTVLHFPIAMAIMGLAVWLPLRARKA